MGKKKIIRPSSYLPYTKQAGLLMSKNPTVEKRDSLFYSGINIATTSDIEDVFDIVKYTKYIFVGNEIGEYVRDHLSDKVIFISAAKISFLSWYLYYDYEVSMFKISIDNPDFKDTPFKELVNQSSFIPIIVYYKSLVDRIAIKHNIHALCYTYRVWLNMKGIDEATRAYIKDKMMWGYSRISEDSYLVIYYEKGKKPTYFDNFDSDYITECMVVDSFYISYDKFRAIESKHDPIMKWYYGYIDKHDSVIRDVYEHIRTKEYTDKVFADDIYLKALLLLVRPDREYTYRYLVCFKTLYYWAIDIELDEDCIRFKKYDPFNDNNDDYYVRDQIFTIELYEDYMVFYDPRYVYSKDYKFELDVRVLNQYLTGDSMYREAIIQLQYKHKEEENMTRTKKSVADETKVEVEKEEKVEVKETGDKKENNLIMQLENIPADTKKRYIILIEEYLPYYINTLSEDNDVEKTIKSALRNLLNTIIGSSKIYTIDTYGLQGIISEALKSISAEDDNTKVFYGNDIVEKFLLWSIDVYDTIIFNDLTIYRGSSSGVKTIQAITSAAEAMCARITTNRSVLNNIIESDLNDKFHYVGPIVYPNADICTVDLDIRYNDIVIGANTSINSIAIVEDVKCKNIIYFIAGVNLDYNLKQLNLLEVSEGNPIARVWKCNMCVDHVNILYNKFLESIFECIAQEINSSYRI